MTIQADKHGRCSRLLLPALLGLAWISNTAAVESRPEYMVKSAYLYNFTRLTQLPEQHFREDDVYNLCIVGDNPFGKHITPLSARPVNGRPLSVDAVYSIKGLLACEMVFIARSEKRKLDTWLKRAAALSILTVSDINGFARRGGMIGLVTHGNRVTFEINHEAALRCNITISAKLLELGDIVRDDRGKDAPCGY